MAAFSRPSATGIVCVQVETLTIIETPFGTARLLPGDWIVYELGGWIPMKTAQLSTIYTTG